MSEHPTNGRLNGQITKILPVTISDIKTNLSKLPSLEHWELKLDENSSGAVNLRYAARLLRDGDLPVAFPTETVYGLGADATRSSAVLGIYKAKQRPADNPLIVHFHSLQQLRDILRPSEHAGTGVLKSSTSDDDNHSLKDDPIPAIYLPLIQKFWPGPLTLIMPNPQNSSLAPEVTAGLKTFGARIPSNPLALALIKLSNLPLAAPSANASTKPSPTAAEHVKHDLEGRISTIIDGGPCFVGLESTVVDGLSNPPVVLRPGGISIESLRTCPGWKDVTIGYKDKAQAEEQPRAPGMKYRHYSPEATVFLFSSGVKQPAPSQLPAYVGLKRKIGVVRTAFWTEWQQKPGDIGLESTRTVDTLPMKTYNLSIDQQATPITLYDIHLGSAPDVVGRGLFSALRELDLLHVDAILVEGINESIGEVAVAVMNRLRKAAEINVH